MTDKKQTATEAELLRRRADPLEGALRGARDRRQAAYIAAYRAYNAARKAARDAYNNAYYDARDALMGKRRG